MFKMNYYQFNRQEILQKAKEIYEYYLKNKEIIKEKSKNRYKNLSIEKKNKLKNIKENISAID